MSLSSASGILTEFEHSAQQDTFMNRISPLIKLVVTVIYVIVVSSFSQYQFLGLIPLAAFPLFVLSLTQISIKPFINCYLLLCLFIVPVGILNLFFDQKLVNFFGIYITGGTISFLSLLIKAKLTLLSALLLVATTGINGIASALRSLHIPKSFVFVVLLTYRYIWVLLSEFAVVTRAHSLRAPNVKGVHFTAWGSLTGGLLLRSFDKAGRTYDAMQLRGFDGEYYITEGQKVKTSDWVYLCCWTIFFIAMRII